MFFFFFCCFLTFGFGLKNPFRNESYSFHGTFYIGHTEQPVSVYTDIINGNIKVEYYGGTNTWIGRLGERAIYELEPRIVHVECFTYANTTDWRRNLRPLFTNTSGWQYTGKQERSGVLVDTWSETKQTDTKGKARGPQGHISTLFARHEIPVELEVRAFTPTGFQEIQFRVVYSSFQWGQPDSAHFKVPTTCSTSTKASMSDKVHELKANWELSRWIQLGVPVSPAQCGEEDDLFLDFVGTHSKAYATCEELTFRKNIFKKNIQYIMEWNGNHRLAVNHLADLSEQEILMMTGHRRPDQKNVVPVGAARGGGGHEKILHYDGRDLPSSWDWRMQGVINEIENQDTCGNCWAFAAAQCVSAHVAIKTGRPPLHLSKQQLSDCGYPLGNNGCGGGLPHLAYENWQRIGGMALDQTYPFLGQEGWCNVNDQSSGHRVTGYVNVTARDPLAMKQALCTMGPVSISIDARAPSFFLYAGGTITDASCKNGENHLDHAVNVVGWDTDEKGVEYWIVKNQWSKVWGLKGYAHIQIEGNICGVMDIPNFPLVE